jgi:alpha-glucoside transport system permease protein
MPRNQPLRFVLNAAVVCLVAAWLLPLLGLVINAFRPFTEASSSGWWTVIVKPDFTFDNFQMAMASGSMVTGLVNSVLITIPSTVLVVAVSATAAFGLVWTDLPGRRWILASLVALIIVPPEITLYPTLVILKALNLVNTFPGVWFSHAASATPFGVFLMASFFMQLPGEMFEAARVDGARPAQQFLKVGLPLSGSAVASLVTLDFLWVWNDLLRALVIIPNPQIRPLTAALANMGGSYGEYVTVVAAGAALLMIPPLIVFLVGQKAFIKGILTGALKS